MSNKFLLPIIVFSLAGILTACDKQGPAEEAGEKIDNIVEDTQKKMDDAVETVTEKTKEAMEESTK